MKVQLGVKYGLETSASSNGFTLTADDGTTIAVSDVVNYNEQNDRSKNNTATLLVTLASKIDTSKVWTLSHEKFGKKEVATSAVVAEEIGDLKYTGDDLGLTLNGTKATFKVWAPTASDVQLLLYEDVTKIGTFKAETVAANYPGIRVDFDGGYQGAERQRAMFVDDSFGGNPSFGIVVVKVSWNSQFEHIGHRDVLGALMGQGIERDRIGDILMSGGTARILADEQMGGFLVDNLTQIGHSTVSCELDDLSNIAPREERCKEIRATVASLRVDSIAAAGYGTSRSHAATDIAADKLRLNWQPVKNASQAVKAGDVLSMRGRGRVEVVEIKGQTKKGRTVVVLNRYI